MKSILPTWLTRRFHGSAFKEVFGCYHIKYCVFDDVSLITGANFSKSYLRNRKDRYFLIRSRKLADFLWDSEALGARGNRSLEEPRAKSRPEQESPGSLPVLEKDEILIFPNVCAASLFTSQYQARSLGIENDRIIFEKLLEFVKGQENLDLTLASSYLNLPDWTVKKLA